MKIGRPRLKILPGIQLGKTFAISGGGTDLQLLGGFSLGGSALIQNPAQVAASAGFGLGASGKAISPVNIAESAGFGLGGNATAASGSYTPLDDPDLFDWWDAQSGVTTAGDPAELSTWIGQAGNPANPPTVTSRPLYGNQQVNSLNILGYLDGLEPNYLTINTSTISSTNCTLTFLAQRNSSPIADFFLSSDTGALCLIDQGNTGVGFSNFGTTIGVYLNGVFQKNNPNRDELDTYFSSNSIISFTGFDLSGISTLYIAARDTITNNGYNGILGDFILSESATKRADNESFLISKYGL